MKSTLKWTGNRSFKATTEDGHSVTLGTAHKDSPKPGPSAMELVLMGAAGCSAFDVVSILEKSRADVRDVTIDMQADRATEPPKVFTRIHFHFRVTGKDLKPAQIERAINLSVDKYCSATAMLEKTATVTHDFDVIEVD